jgi:hypothetical protein
MLSTHFGSAELHKAEVHSPDTLGVPGTLRVCRIERVDIEVINSNLALDVVERGSLAKGGAEETFLV